MPLSKGLRGFIELLNSNGVEYVIVGAYALAFHGRPRATGVAVQLGHPPHRIDILTSLTGVSFDKVWSGRVCSTLDSLPVAFIGKQEFIQNKRALGRLRDRADLEDLGNG